MEFPRRRQVLRTVGGALAAGAAGCLSGESSDDTSDPSGDVAVEMARYDAGNTGTHPAATGPTGSLSAAWEFRVEYRNAFFTSQPAVADDTVFAGVVIFGELPAALLAIDAADGTERWRLETEYDVVATPAVGEDHVYAVADGVLRTLDRSNGDEDWTYPLPEGGGDPTLVEDTVYVVGGEPTVHAVDASTGESRWTASADTTSRSWGRTPAIADGRVYVTDRDEGAVIALDAGAAGETRWRAPVDEPTDAPVATGEAVFVGDQGGGLHCIDTGGAVQWSESAVGASFYDDVGVVAPALAEDVLYSSGQGGELTAVGVDGEPRWRADLSFQPFGAPVVADDVVYVAGATSEEVEGSTSDGGVVYGVSTDGEVVLEHRDADAHGPPAVLDGTAYLSVLRSEGATRMDLTALR